MFPIARMSNILAAVIANGAALSNAIPMSDHRGGMLITPAAWTAAAIAFQICDTPGGTFVPLRGSTGAVIEITNVVTNAAAAYPLPAELTGAAYFKIWSETAGAGTDANQGAARSLTVCLKS
jgi:hypothetical protein